MKLKPSGGNKQKKYRETRRKKKRAEDTQEK